MSTLKDTSVIVKEFSNWLKNTIGAPCYRCKSCGYSQGHQINYCPKCPNSDIFYEKGLHQWDQLKYNSLDTYEFHFKNLVQNKFLNGEYLNWDQWDAVKSAVYSEYYSNSDQYGFTNTSIDVTIEYVIKILNMSAEIPNDIETQEHFKEFIQYQPIHLGVGKHEVSFVLDENYKNDVIVTIEIALESLK